MDVDRQGPPATAVARALRAGICPDDRAFDRFLPYPLQRASSQHWTPLVVVRQVARWLDEFGIRTVVDIGSGAGKLCVAGAVASPAFFIGVEQRLGLVEEARALAALFGVEDRVRFIHGALGQSVLPRVDAYYLYNPFGENIYGSDAHLGDDVELSAERYERDVAFTESFLRRVRIGTYVIKYNGFGGRMPQNYQVIRVNRQMPNMLRMWRKTRL